MGFLLSFEKDFVTLAVKKGNPFSHPTLRQGDLRMTATMEHQSHSVGMKT